MKVNFLVLTFRFFVSDVVSEVGFSPFWLMLTGLGPNCWMVSISLKFSLETNIESEPFEPLIDFLAFLVHKLWPKINKIINYLIRGLITHIVVKS